MHIFFIEIHSTTYLPHAYSPSADKQPHFPLQYSRKVIFSVICLNNPKDPNREKRASKGNTIIHKGQIC